jgi:hypothetical protein
MFSIHHSSTALGGISTCVFWSKGFPLLRQKLERPHIRHIPCLSTHILLGIRQVLDKSWVVGCSFLRLCRVTKRCTKSYLEMFKIQVFTSVFMGTFLTRLILRTDRGYQSHSYSLLPPELFSDLVLCSFCESSNLLQIMPVNTTTHFFCRQEWRREVQKRWGRPENIVVMMSVWRHIKVRTSEFTWEDS